MTRRADQVASLVRGAVQDVLTKGFQDPRIRGLITITDVTVSPDLKAATIKVSVLPEDRQELTIHGLRAAARHIRHEVSEKLELRRTPDLHFKLDTSLKKQAGVYDALAQIAREREARGEPPPPDASNQDDSDPTLGAQQLGLSNLGTQEDPAP
ncbi:MAG: 30S ribosome-binding factor RbfA [Phycisphaeraceae bacterium]|nr:30S ribosome-binding factor RbfA [Phycisphaeraceae bacterium]MBX3366307.1 30S ribosome-binding factor RbfA [Phycisphaeraceae bacterium]QYK48763.1 MAG: 30S ribosome-binding factor RbfA [Phycisphaeraceae bacterium]